MHYTCIGLYRISFANLHLDFQYEIPLQSLWFSLQDFTALNGLIQPVNLSHHHLSLPPSVERHRPWADSGRGDDDTHNWQPPFIEQTDHDRTTQSNQWSHFETGPALRRPVSTRPQQQLSNAFRELQKTRDVQLLLNRSQAYYLSMYHIHTSVR